MHPKNNLKIKIFNPNDDKKRKQENKKEMVFRNVFEMFC